MVKSKNSSYKSKITVVFICLLCMLSALFIYQSPCYGQTDKDIDSYVAEKASHYEDMSANKSLLIDVTDFNIPYSSGKEMFAKIEANHPELFYMDTKVKLYSNDEGKSLAFFEVFYLSEKKDIDREIPEFNKKAKDAINYASKSADQVGQLLALHDYLVLNCKYGGGETLDMDVQGNRSEYTAYGALVNGHAVCQGYADAYLYLLRQMGWEGKMVQSSSMSHGWNLVKIDSSWYHVDATWDDPVYDTLGQVKHTNFLLSDQAMTANRHSGWDADVTCNSTKYDDYYWKEIDTAIIPFGSYWYFCENTSGKLRLERVEKLDEGTNKEIIWSDDGQWLCKNGYENGAIRLVRKGNKLYFNNQKSILSYDKDGAIVTEFTPELAENQYIWSFMVNADGYKYTKGENPEDTELVSAPFEQQMTPATKKAIVSIERFTLGEGYLVKPYVIEYPAEYNAAQMLDQMMMENDLSYDYKGTLKSNFYLASIDDADTGILDVPQCLRKMVYSDGSPAEDPVDSVFFTNDEFPALGEFDYSMQSGWMYTVNGEFPNVGFSQKYLEDGDVVRVQFTLIGLGADLGSSGGSGLKAINVADKTELTRLLAEGTYAKEKYDYAIKIAEKLDAAQAEVDECIKILSGEEVIPETPDKPDNPETPEPVQPAELKSIKLSYEQTIYSGKAKVPGVTVVDNNGKILKKGTDYKVSFKNNKNAGTATVTVTGLGKYGGNSLRKTFKIVPKKIVKFTAKIDYSKTIYSGKAKKPGVILKDKTGVKLVKGIDYKVTYKNNTKVGKATVTVTGLGNYQGTISKSFKINPKGTCVSALKAASKGFTVKYKKQTAQTTGYQVRYSVKPSMEKAKTVTIKNSKTTSVKVKKLTGKKKYFVQVRTYKSVNGVKYYSVWSEKKSIITKK